MTDKGEPAQQLARLKTIQAAYRELIKLDKENEVLGKAENYYRLYTKEALLALRGRSQPDIPKKDDDWLIPFANNVDLDTLKYPVVLVQEYGWSLFRLAASASQLLEALSNASVYLSSKVEAINPSEKESRGWRIDFTYNGQTSSTEVDYLINACGFETGTLDDLLNVPRDRLVEFKAAYVTQWQREGEVWPEVIFHGERSTVDGMAQLTPYADGLFQLHGMTEDITLFKDGLARSDKGKAQPKLPEYLIAKIQHGWNQEQIKLRTELAIKHMSRFIPTFKSAEIAGLPLFGAQQIPGSEVSLRAADVSFYGNNYARMEIVKGSSAIEAANKIVHVLGGIYSGATKELQPNAKLSGETVEQKAILLAKERGYPAGLAKVTGLK